MVYLLKSLGKVLGKSHLTALGQGNKARLLSAVGSVSAVQGTCKAKERGDRSRGHQSLEAELPWMQQDNPGARQGGDGWLRRERMQGTSLPAGLALADLRIS